MELKSLYFCSVEKPALVRLLRLRVWLADVLRLGELHGTLFWAGLVGFIGGVTSLIFRGGIHEIQWILTRHAGSLVETAFNLPPWQRLLVPAIGGMLAGLVIHLGMRLVKGQSSTDYMEAIALGDGVIRLRSTLVESLSSLLTIASGGSIGREGPMVQLSAMTASFLGCLANFSTPRLRLITACGAAAGIASAYNAPIAGALFVAEVILGSIAMESFGPLIFSSVIATVTVRQLFDAKPIFKIPSFELISNFELVPYLMLGAIAGLAAPWFLRLLKVSERLFVEVKVPLFVRLGLGGVIVGILSIVCPEVWGNGYSVVDSILHVDWLWQMLLFVLVFKLLATAATVGSGAVGGVLTPTLFVGAVIGCLFGQPLHAFWPEWTAPANAYALVGMGCFLAATTQAPLMAILMIFEMTLDYSIVLPLMLACVTAFYISHGLQRGSIYTQALERKRSKTRKQPPSAVHVRDLLKPDSPTVFENANFHEIAQAFSIMRHNHLYVTNKQGKFLGAIPLHDIKSYLSETHLANIVIALDLIGEDFPMLTPEAPLSEALEKFSSFAVERIPVVENFQNRKLLGTISKTDLLLTLFHGTDKAKPALANQSETRNRT